MMLLQLDPFSKPVALIEILILLLAASLIGWLIARQITKRDRAATLEAIQQTKSKLAFCLASKEYKGGHSELEKNSRTGFPAQKDNLQIIEGIGPKVEELIYNAGILTFEQLSNTSPVKLLEIIKNAGHSFQMHDPASWPTQAHLAHAGKWQELEILKDKLIAGRQK